MSRLPRFAAFLLLALFAAGPAFAAQPVIDVNSAPAVQLAAALHGIGPARADDIVKNRPYIFKEDLIKKAGLSASVFAGIRDKVALADINRTSAADMKAILTGIGDARAAAIVKGRPYKAPEDLVKKGILTQAVFDGIRDEVIAGR